MRACGKRLYADMIASRAPAWKRHPSVLLARALDGNERQRRVSGVLFLHPVPVTALGKAQVAREARRLRGATFGRLTASQDRLQRLEIYEKLKCRISRKERGMGGLAGSLPCRQIGHELESSSSHGSTHA